MQVDIFNTELVQGIEPTFTLSSEYISNGYINIFNDRGITSVNIVFVKSAYMRELNMRYIGSNTPTDVLSFNLSESEIVGEIYISPEYVHTAFKGDEFTEEILRLIIHGTLHILGYTHKGNFNDSPNEDMYILQEKLLLKYKEICL